MLHMTSRASQMLKLHLCGYAWLGSELTSPFVENSEEERRSHFHTRVKQTKNQLEGGLTRRCRIVAHNAVVMPQLSSTIQSGESYVLCTRKVQDNICWSPWEELRTTAAPYLEVWAALFAYSATWMSDGTHGATFGLITLKLS